VKHNVCICICCMNSIRTPHVCLCHLMLCNYTVYVDTVGPSL